MRQTSDYNQIINSNSALAADFSSGEWRWANWHVRDQINFFSDHLRSSDNAKYFINNNEEPLLCGQNHCQTDWFEKGSVTSNVLLTVKPTQHSCIHSRIKFLILNALCNFQKKKQKHKRTEMSEKIASVARLLTPVGWVWSERRSSSNVTEKYSRMCSNFC